MKISSSLFLPLLLLLLLLLFSLLISPSHSDIAVCNEHDQAVLLQIKSHFGGVGGLSDWDPDWTCCDWDYVGCYESDEDDPKPNPRYGRVNAVTLPAGQGLSGDLPSALANLPFLKAIMFTGEPKLTGPIPHSWNKLHYLTSIDLSSNSLTGEIPDFLGQMKDLDFINLSNNRFTGRIPPSLSHLHQLAVLDLSNNNLTGGIPKLHAKKLKVFDVSFNQLCGRIPTVFKGFNATSFLHNKCLCGAPLKPCNLQVTFPAAVDIAAGKIFAGEDI